MVIESRLITVEQLEVMPEDGNRRELINGEVIIEMPPGFEHSVIAGIVVAHFWRYLASNPIGLAAGEGGYVLRRSPDTVRAPDAAVVLHSSRGSAEIPRTYLPRAPDLAVEVVSPNVSPNDSAIDVADKVSDWLDAGTQLVWVIYPARPMLVAHYPDRTARRFGHEDLVDAMPVLPGFSMLLPDLLRPPKQ